MCWSLAYLVAAHAWIILVYDPLDNLTEMLLLEDLLDDPLDGLLDTYFLSIMQRV